MAKTFGDVYYSFIQITSDPLHSLTECIFIISQEEECHLRVRCLRKSNRQNRNKWRVMWIKLYFYGEISESKQFLFLFYIFL